METIKTINGNGKGVIKRLPKLVILGKINDGALAHIFENTGLVFKPGIMENYEAQPKTSNQIARLFLTYNFKTRYYDNWEAKNTLFLKNDHHTGFDVESICFECVKHNHINVNGLNPGDYLAC